VDRQKQQAVRQRIRQMLEQGEMPCDEPDKTWAGRGTGTHCAACGETIQPSDIEYEVDLLPGATLRLHRDCHDIWQEECWPHRTGTPSS
jgi:hypothetical protein